MTLDQVMDLQYRKLLTVREDIWNQLEPVWDSEDDEDMPFAPNINAVGVLLLVDLDRMNLPELDETQRDMIEPLVVAILDCEEMDMGISLPLEYRQTLVKVLETNRISDEWNRKLALKVTGFANEISPMLFIGKEHLAEILQSSTDGQKRM